MVSPRGADPGVVDPDLDLAPENKQDPTVMKIGIRIRLSRETRSSFNASLVFQLNSREYFFL